MKQIKTIYFLLWLVLNGQVPTPNKLDRSLEGETDLPVHPQVCACGWNRCHDFTPKKRHRISCVVSFHFHRRKKNPVKIAHICCEMWRVALSPPRETSQNQINHVRFNIRWENNSPRLEAGKQVDRNVNKIALQRREPCSRQPRCA